MAERGIAINGVEPTVKNESMKASWITPVSSLLWAVLVIAAMNPGNAAEPASDPESKSTEELAKKTQNPVANLISIRPCRVDCGQNSSRSRRGCHKGQTAAE